MQLLTPSRIIAETNGRDQICKSDIEEAASLFFEGKQSSKILVEEASGFIGSS